MCNLISSFFVVRAPWAPFTALRAYAAHSGPRPPQAPLETLIFRHEHPEMRPNSSKGAGEGLETGDTMEIR
jgi:hypothetical protein